MSNSENISPFGIFMQKYRIAAAFLAVAIITFICFAPDLGNELLIWDDSGYIVDNPLIRELSLETVRSAFTGFHCNYWAPLTWLSLALDYAIWGLNPVGYHLTNNLIHALNAGMFFLLCLELLRRYMAGTEDTSGRPPILNRDTSLYCALLAALFFAIHPLRVESVAWATERKDVLSMMFGLPAIIAYLRHVQSMEVQPAGEGRRHSFHASPCYWITVVLFTLSLLSKAMLVTLPVVLLVLDWFPLRRYGKVPLKVILGEKVPLLLLAWLASSITVKAMAVTIKSLEEINLVSRALIAFKSSIAYLWMMVWPAGLSAFYLHPGNIATVTPDYAVSILLFVLVSAFCLLQVRHRPVYAAAWLIYLITVFPVLGFTQTGPQAMAGRFTYLPGLSLSLLAALGVAAAHARVSGSQPARAALLVSVSLLLLASCFFTWKEIAYWKDDIALWSRVIELKPHFSGRAYAQRGYAYAVKGEYRKALDDVNEALAIAKRRNYKALHEIYSQRARVRKGLGEMEGAIADFTSALETADLAKRPVYLMERGEIYRELGMIDRADDDFRAAGGAQ